VAAGDEMGTRARHAAYFLALAESGQYQLRGPRQADWLARLEHEHDNLRAALRWCVEHRQEGQALRFGSALCRFWRMRGHVAEGRQRLIEVLALTTTEGPADALERARALNGAGNLSAAQGDTTAAKSLYEQSLAIHRRREDRLGIAVCLANLGNVARDRGNHREARSFYQESMAIQRELGDRWGIALLLNNLGGLARMSRISRRRGHSTKKACRSSANWGTAGESRRRSRDSQM
jgi:tetratricopeptide (TPR) repeat protein